MSPSPETYYKIILLMLGREAVVMGFSLADFFANGGKQVLLNSAAQYGGYIATQAVGNTITPAILVPFVANSKLAADFIQVSQNMPGQPERVATIAFLFATAGLITKTGDIPTNVTMGALIGAFVDYMGHVVDNDKVPFLFRGAKRMNLTIKQHIQIHILLTGLILASLGCFVIIVYFTKQLVKGYKRFLRKSFKTIKNLRIKRLNNSNISTFRLVD